MDSKHYLICLRPDSSGKWSVYHHKPGFPDLCCHEGTEAECIAWARKFKAQLAFEMQDFYHVGPDRIWRPIENLP